ncbi:MAG TPA: type II secretion system F family protein [Actinocrinis sp.]|jgi:Flp pilus assembly protein TadB|uniref:type II secretion system F family protein n=1 Tax=Actinocrinis sp. TaxID=1920516 RepID=UPI002DDCF003|nr:type II secretion system F family protein [Actinocrinis sp.]HEV3170107.1 type II secretion system F family protein [Actinocrinis sp.]
MNPAELFTQGTAEAIAFGLVAGLGLTLLIVGLVGFPRRPKDPTGGPDSAALIQRYGQRTVIALAVGLVVGLASQWPVLGLGAIVLTFFWRELFGGAGAEKLAMRRVEALAMWTESLRDTIAGAVGLEQAIPATTRAADPALREPLNAMLDRLRGRMPLPEALQHFADDINDSSADLVIAALILNSKLRGPGLRDVLTALGRSAREEVDMRQRIIAQRAGTRRSVQIIVGVVVGFVLLMAIFNRGFMRPYGTPMGELVLTAVLGLFGFGFWWLRRLAMTEPPSRFLIKSAAREPMTPLYRPQQVQATAEGMAPPRRGGP